jgi:hypothetical protein
VSFDPGVFDPELFGAGLLSEESCLFDGAIFDSAVFDVCVEDVAEVPPVAQRARRGRRYRIIEDPDKIVDEVRVEEKKVEKDKKRLVILIRRSEAPNVHGVLYQQIQSKVEKLEAKIDDRLERIAFLVASLDLDDEDDEEVMFL